MSLQTIITLLVIASAAAYLAYRWYPRRPTPGKPSSGCGCAGCVTSACAIKDAKADTGTSPKE